MTRPTTRRRKRRSENPSRVRVLLVGGSVALLLVVVTAFAVKAPDGIPGTPAQTLYAEVPDAGNLQPHVDVRIAGVRVGQVLDIEPSGRAARVRFRVDGAAGGIPTGSTVAVRGRGLLGQRFLEVRPGRGPSTLPDGATVRGGPDALTFGIPDVLDTFDEPTRDGLDDTLAGLGVGLLGRGTAISSALRGAPEAGRSLQSLVSVVLERGAPERLLPSVASAARALSDSRDELREVICAVPPGLAPLADEGDHIRDSLGEAPTALAAARAGLDDGTRILRSTRALARAAHRTLPAAPGGLRATTALLDEAPRPLARVTALLDEARATIPPTLTLTGRLRPLLAPVERAASELVDPVVVLGAHGCDVENMVDNWHSALGFGVLGGSSFGPLNNFRVTPVIGPESIGGVQPSQPPAGAHRDPYPEPCRYSPEGGPIYDVGATPAGGTR
jgi:phospholipid/cholesterol/gamma-HCH transport system substrate-binding protein